MRARDILHRPVVTVRPETPLPEAVELLTGHGFAALPVVDDNDRVVGLLSESDALAAGSAMQTAVVEAVMRVPVEVIRPGTDISTIASLLLDGHRRSLPVVEAGLLVGIVSRRDVLRALVRDDATIEAKIRALLDDYAGSRKQWTIDVRDGRATIAGVFADTAEERIIASLARTVDGVTHIDTVSSEPITHTAAGDPPN